MKRKLIFVNDVPSKFAKHCDYIRETIKDFFDALDCDCKLKVKFIEHANINEYEVTDCMLRSISTKKHELIITNSAMDAISFDGGGWFCLAIYHEMEHIRDYVKMMGTKLFKFNLSEVYQKNIEHTYVVTGYLFWTEIYAYYKTIKYAKYNDIKYERIPFGNLVKKYIKLVETNKNIYLKQDLGYDEAYKYIKMVYSFVYLCSKYMASSYADHSRLPYGKIFGGEDKQYKKVYSILCDLDPKVRGLFNNMYGPKSYVNLFKLGKYICEKLRWKNFKVGLIKRNGKICPFY